MRNNFSNLLAIAAGTVLLSGAVRAETLRPKILKVVPDAVYANETDFAYPLYKIKVFGEKFAPEDSNLRIYLDGRDATVVWAKPPPKPTPAPAGATKPAPVDKGKDPEIYADRDAGSSRVDLWINKNHFHGTVNLTVGNAPADSSPVIRSDESVAIVLAERDFGCLFQIGAVAVSLLILALPIFLVKITGSYGLPDKSRWLVAALFLDKETATYSLSKFQFYLWTAVSVFGYIYLFAAHYLVQGVWEFIEIPKTLPGIVFISAATGAAAQVVTNFRGPKGAGEEHPSYADFVSSGGIIVAERFQFFIWTIIGSLAFFYLVISQDPATIHVLPTVPDGFLQLMGISSFGYLAGKLARQAGPVIDNVKAEKIDDASTKITLRGRILSPTATFKIDYEPPREDGKKEENLTALLNSTPKVVDIDEQTKPTETAKTLELIVKIKCEDMLRGASKFVISNPDGQSASWPFAAAAAPPTPAPGTKPVGA